VLREIEERVEAIAARHGFPYELECYQFLPATHLDHGHALVRALVESVEAVCHAAPRIKAFEATCEAPFLSVERQIPTLVFGPGSLARAHTVDEYVELAEVLEAAVIYAELAQRLGARTEGAAS
jgi:acetylornithine deacetylase/succinyl-diaminopimelate desuccinylase-like protein